MSARFVSPLLISIALFAGASGSPAGSPSLAGEREMLDKLVGKWKGTCKTWLEPGKLGDESEVAGEFVRVLGGKLVRHTYAGKILGKPRHGEELIAYNSTAKVFQTSWMDDFHMSDAILFSEGKAIDHGFSVLGHYSAGNNQPKWGWRTEYRFIDDTHLTITAYNVTPKSEEAKAVELSYTRVP